MAKRLSEYQIMEIEASDLDKIIEIENYSFKTPWPKQAFEIELKSKKSYNIICRESSGRITGYCLSWLIYDEIHILKIAVDKDYRQLGIGTILMNDTLDHYKQKGANHAVLEVRTDNDSAIKMYEKFGFFPLRIRTNYYRETGEDALVMMLDLEDNKY